MYRPQGVHIEIDFLFLILFPCWGTEKPGYAHFWCQNMTNDKSSERSCTLLKESAKKTLQVCKIWFFFAKSSYIIKCLLIKCPKNDKMYIFEKPLTMLFQICKIFGILINLMWFYGKLKMCKFLLTCYMQITSKISFAKLD